MRRIISAILCASVVFALSVSAAADAVFPQPPQPASAPIQVAAGTDGYVAVRLTPEVYAAANTDLSDLRIRDSAGEDVPYFVYSATQQSTTSWGFHKELVLWDAFDKNDEFYFDYYVTDVKDTHDVVATVLSFTARNDNFAKAVDVYGSYDGNVWAFVQSDMLYSVDGTSKLEIAFDLPQKFTYYRLKLAHNQEKIAFDTVSISASSTTVDTIRFIEELTPQFKVETVDNRTNITIFGMKNLPIKSVEFVTQSRFKRQVSSTSYLGAYAELYNLEFDGVSYSNTTLEAEPGRVAVGDTVVVTIQDNDDKPIDIDGVFVIYYADELVFEAKRGETYTLHCSADMNALAPIYDIASYAGEILRGEVGTATLGAIAYGEPVPPAPVPRDYTMVFNVVVVGVAILLAVVILLRLRKKT